MKKILFSLLVITAGFYAAIATQLTATSNRTFEVPTAINTLPVAANVIIYKGSAVGSSNGYATQLIAPNTFKGFAENLADNSSAAAGAKNVQVRHSGIVQLTVDTAGFTDPTADGQPVYASDGNTFTLTQGSNSRIGTVHRFISTNLCMVKFNASDVNVTSFGTLTNSTTGSSSNIFAAGVGRYTLSIPITLAQITGAGDVLTTHTVNHKFKILSLDSYVVKAVTTASKAATLNMEIGTVNLTGGAIALTSANCTPLGAKVAGSSVTAANTGAAGDTISIEAASVTAFAEGEVVVLVEIQNMDTADALAGTVSKINEILAAQK